MRISSSQPPGGIKSGKILVIDDDEDIRLLLEKGLQGAGYQVFQAANGLDGIQAALALLPDVILLDVTMPMMNGDEVCRVLQDNEKTRRVPVIFLTGREELESRLGALEAGAVDYILKPFNLEELLARLRSQFKILRLYEEIENYVTQINIDLELARQVQKSILPLTIPHLLGVNIAAAYQASETVSGDYYDIIKLSGEEVILLAADVSGHGIAAAFITAMAKMSFKNHLTQDISLVNLLRCVNQDFNDVLRTEHYLTAVVCRFNCRTRVLTWAKAGHITQILLKNSGSELVELGGGGLFLGTFEDGMFEEKSILLSDGDKLILFTDGLIECKNLQGEEFGKQRLINEVISRYEEDPVSLVGSIAEAQERFLGSHGRLDDFTLVVMEVGRESRMEKIKQAAGFSYTADLVISDFSERLEIRPELDRMGTLLEYKKIPFDYNRQIKMCLQVMVSSFFKVLSPGQRVRMVWQIENRDVAMAVLVTQKGEVLGLSGEDGLKGHFLTGNPAVWDLLSKVFDKLEFLEENKILLLIKQFAKR